jgi:hypothetical protein
VKGRNQSYLKMVEEDENPGNDEGMRTMMSKIR